MKNWFRKRTPQTRWNILVLLFLTCIAFFIGVGVSDEDSLLCDIFVWALFISFLFFIRFTFWSIVFGISEKYQSKKALKSNQNSTKTDSQQDKANIETNDSQKAFSKTAVQNPNTDSQSNMLNRTLPLDSSTRSNNDNF